VSERRRSGPLLGGEEGLPYSKGLMARALIAAGVNAVRAYELAQRIELDLAGGGNASTTFERLDDLATEVLGAEDGKRAVGRLRRYRRLQELDLPLILLIGGATGTGKSTVATEVAWRLGITRVTSTDFVRQTMRAFFSTEFMPSIHYSSFEAAQALRAPDEAVDAAVAGFLEQTRNVLVGVRAALERALEEGWSMVLEGVHLVPGLIPPPIDDAIVVQCVLAIEDEAEHRSHFVVRDVASDGVRSADKYIRGFPEIRRIQDAIVARAERAGVPVVENGNVEEAIGGVMELVLDSAEALETNP
jgi:2-phosphoglycerate kinase